MCKHRCRNRTTCRHACCEDVYAPWQATLNETTVTTVTTVSPRALLLSETLQPWLVQDVIALIQQLVRQEVIYAMKEEGGALYYYDPAADVWAEDGAGPVASSGGAKDAARVHLVGGLWQLLVWTGNRGELQRRQAPGQWSTLLMRHGKAPNYYGRAYWRALDANTIVGPELETEGTDRLINWKALNLATGSERPVDPLTYKANAVVVCMGGRLYVADGTDSNKWWVLDDQHGATSNVIAPFPPHSTLAPHTSGIAAAALDQHRLMVAGGHLDGTNFTVARTLEPNNAIYDSHNNTWTVIAGLNTPRNQHSLVVANGHAYVLGGHSNSLLGQWSCTLLSVERYNVSTNNWTICQPLPASCVGTMCDTSVAVALL